MEVGPIEELRASGRIAWLEDQGAWVAQPEEIVQALAHSGFNEYKREETRSRRDRQPSGGVWQGVNGSGAVASALWVNQPDTEASIVYIDIDGDPVRA